MRGPEKITERHVQAIWYDREMRPEGLATSGGEPVEVVHPGKWNLGPGPDFKGAVIKVGGKRIKGDVEVHLSPGDWTAHGHGRDPAYRGVVAHVTWDAGPTPDKLPDGAVSLSLKSLMTKKGGFMPELVDLSAYPFSKLPADERPCAGRVRGDPDLARAVLSSAGRYRLRLKARRMRTILSERPRERRQVFYEEVMNALGYGKNSSAMRKVAELVPWRILLDARENAEVALLGAAEFVEWNRGCCRPGNSPEARLSAAARLFLRPETAKLADAVDFSPAGCRAIVKELVAERLMGRGRAGAVVANVVVPFAMAEGRLGEAPGWLPPEDISEPMRITALRMLGREHNPAAYSGNDVLVQGLLQIHREFCLKLHPECVSCGVASGETGEWTA